eukprot:43888-Eustigmatos_ZCMA.PRE.1
MGRCCACSSARGSCGPCCGRIRSVTARPISMRRPPVATCLISNKLAAAPGSYTLWGWSTTSGCSWTTT